MVMKSARAFLSLGIAAVCMVLASCGGSNGSTGSMPPMSSQPPSATKDLDTAAVLSIVQTQTSETADPFPVDDRAVVVTPVGDETGTPISVDAT